MLLALLACRPDPEPQPDSPVDSEAPHTPSTDPCMRVRAGAPGPEGVTGLSEAHADLRLFGLSADFTTVDAALILSLEGDALAPDLEAYAAATELVCLLDARAARWGPPPSKCATAPGGCAPAPERSPCPTTGLRGERSAGALYVVTEDRMAPASAELAAAVQLGESGAIVGVDVLAAVAEMRWSGIGDRGFAWRAEVLEDADMWPDTIPAAARTDDPEALIPTLGELTLPARGGAERDDLRKRSPFGETVDETQSVATLRASLVIAHGGLRRFFPYFHVVGDQLDERLLEVLAQEIDPTDRIAHRARLDRLGNVLSDGHMFAGALDPTGMIAGYLPARFLHIDGEPVVVRSSVVGLDPGDRIVAVDGVPVADLQADWLTWHGGATDGYRLDVADRELLYMQGSQTLTVVDPDGTEEEVSADPRTVDDLLALPAAWILRENVTLDDLGAPDVVYLNLDQDATTSLAQVDAALAMADTARGLVVDMRGYPGVSHYTVLGGLVPGDYGSPIFRVPTWTGAERFEVVESQYSFTGGSDAYSGPIVLLVGPSTVSAAENFAQMLMGAGRVTAVVGSSSSAGTNGNITGFTLPGAYYLSFTGMEVLNPAGSTFHGVGIPADLVVEPTPADLREGRDPVLEAALTLIP